MGRESSFLKSRLILMQVDITLRNPSCTGLRESQDSGSSEGFFFCYSLPLYHNELRVVFPLRSLSKIHLEWGHLFYFYFSLTFDKN